MGKKPRCTCSITLIINYIYVCILYIYIYMGVFGEQVCDGSDRGAQGISDLETDLIEVG